jgi:hypothetical protein
VYDIEAKSPQHATERMVEAIVKHAEAHFHVKDVLRKPGQPPGQVTSIDLRPTRWLAAMRHQLDEAEERVLKAAKRYFAKQ